MRYCCLGSHVKIIKYYLNVLILFFFLPTFWLQAHAADKDKLFSGGVSDDIIFKMPVQKANSPAELFGLFNQLQTDQNGMAEILEAAFSGDTDFMKQKIYRNININHMDIKLLERAPAIFEYYKPMLKSMFESGLFANQMGNLKNFDDCYNITMLVIKKVIAYYKGDYGEVEKLMKRVIELSMAGFGNKGIETGIQINNLASFYMELHRYEDAEFYLRQAINIFNGNFGNNSLINEAVAKFNLGMTLIKKQKLAEGKELLKEALKIVQKFDFSLDVKIIQANFLSSICEILKKEEKYSSIING